MLTAAPTSRKTFNPGTVNEKTGARTVVEPSTLPPVDFATIVGSNGAGKSTLFNAIAGSFYGGFQGAIELDGKDITLPRRSTGAARCIGRLFQDPLTRHRART